MANTCVVLQFAAFQKPVHHRKAPGSGLLRSQRRDAWWDAESVRCYWRARLDMEIAIACVQRRGLPEGRNHPETTRQQVTIDSWRVAIGCQLLTPAPDVAAVTWKRAQLKTRNFAYIGLKAARVEQAIADDLAWLAAHRVRQSKREA